MGALTLRIGSRRTLAASLLGLAMATLAFARASSLRELLAARALQGAASYISVYLRTSPYTSPSPYISARALQGAASAALMS